MKRAIAVLSLASVAVLLMAAGRGSSGTTQLKTRADQTTANTKIVEFISGADGLAKASIDIEGDIIANDATLAGDLTVTGTLTAGVQTYSGSDFTTDITVTTDKLVITAASGNLATLGTLSAAGDFKVNTNKLVVTASSGNTAVAGTLAVTGASTLTGAVAVTGAVTAASTLTVAGAIAGPRTIITAASGTTALLAAQSGALVYNTGTSATTTFTLPTAAAGLHFCFAELGDAAGELLINPFGSAADVIVAKTHGAENGTGIATSANSGIKNTAATNVKGDFICLTAVDATTWVATSVAGVWAAQ